MSQPLRIAFCEDRFHSFYGAQQNVYNLARHLPASFEPVMVTTAEGEFARRCRAAGLAVHLLPIAPVAGAMGGQILRYGLVDRLRVGAALADYNLRFSRWVQAERIDVVVCDGFRFPLQVALATRARRLPLLVFLQGEVGQPWLTDLLYNVCDRMMVIAGALGAEFSPRVRGHSPEKLVTLNTGFSFEPLATAQERGRALRARWGIAPEAIAIGQVGSITPRKGADVLIEAAPAILRAQPQAHFVLVGHAPPGHEDFLHRLKARAAELGFGARLFVTGFHDDMAAAYGALDLTTLPSRSEGLPGVVIESLAYGVPCVATTVGGTADILRDPRFGRLVAPDDPAALARELVAMLGAEPLSAERAAWTRQTFSTEGYVRRFVAILERSGLAPPSPLVSGR